MYKNQLQELAQRSCFNLPSYSCIREGPDHAPRFKATVNFNGEVFESPNFCTTLRQAEHSAAEVALNSLSNRGPSHSLAARILDETGVYKNLLQEIAQRVGAPLPLYTTFRSGLGHLPVFTCTVELAGIIFTGEPAKNKKQAEKNAAMAAWSSLKQLAQQAASSSTETENNDEQEQITIARALLNYRLKEKLAMADTPNAPSPFPRKFPMQNLRPSTAQPPPLTTSRILPLIRPKSAPRNRPAPTTPNDSTLPSRCLPTEGRGVRPQKFPAAGAAPYIPIRHFRPPYHGVAPPVTIRTAVPVFSAPPLPPPAHRPPPLMGPPPVHISPPVCIRQAVPVFAAPPVRIEEQPVFPLPSTPAKSPVQIEEPPVSAVPSPPAKSPILVEEVSVSPVPPPPAKSPVQIGEPPVSPVPPTLPAKSPVPIEENEKTSEDDRQESSTIQDLEQLKI
ncbi:Double-stranded RNA-binding domain [Macleaya cordata]|uniref:Double-stranded RNA-binding domain n=1 Tax=Macleaya cordata TaxID=56857 RepID=A0A200QI23_MACCD|nr:Double-stranded RNA-binding domain [Macleaya cordata]